MVEREEQRCGEQPDGLHHACDAEQLDGQREPFPLLAHDVQELVARRREHEHRGDHGEGGHAQAGVDAGAERDRIEAQP